MKSLLVIAFGILMFATSSLNGQDKSPIPGIGRQLNEYFSAYPRQKVFVTTDKSQYRPGETIWFRAFVTDAANLPVRGNSLDLFVKLFNKKGEAIQQDIFKITNGAAVGDLQVPKNLDADNYFLVAYTPLFHAADRIACRPVRIDPQYNTQWIARSVLKDSISEAGSKSVLSVTVHEISGDVVKKTSLRFEFRNGSDVLEKGKVKTDENGQVDIPLTIPAKSNGEPFVCEITDLRENWKHDTWIPTTLDPVVINFYPEGETRVVGAASKIGFTAFNKWGIPVDISGQVTDQDGKNILFVKTFTKGLGLITLRNSDSQNLKFVTDKNQSFSIPSAVEAGLSLTVTKTDTAFISANFIFPDQQKHPVSIVVSRAGNIYWAGDLEINGSSRVKIPSENLPQGINLLSVFDSDGKLLANRILYTDQNHLIKVDVRPEKTSIQPGQSLKVNVQLSNENGQPVAGSVAVAVSDKFRNEMPCPDIEKNLLVASELKTPFSLISYAFQDKITNTALLDIFLLSNKIKDFSWANILSFKPGNAPDLRSLNNQITGVVTDKNGNTVNKAKVMLVNNRNIQIYSTTTNEDGMFSFTVNPSANEDFSVKATDQDGKHDLNVTYGKNFDEQLSGYVKQIAQTRQLSRNDRFPDQNYVSNNPFLFPKMPKAPAPSESQRLENQRRMLESSTSILDVIKSIKPYKIMNNMIVFSGTENSLMAQGGALFVVDGQQMGTDISAISSISPLEVDHISVSTNAMDIQRYTGLNSVGIVEIFLKRGKGPEEKTENKIQNKYEGGVRVPNSFEAGDKENTTLLWIPNQQVDSSGKFEFTVPAGKIISDFVIDIQGMTPDGRMGSGEALISVKK